ncbi:VOC family protein [Pacificibacter marinus]|uniref:VOC family protein n=1 Tax=Pacificibacter marinus TaxID=658057 RepID=UPI001C06CD4E|nr:VOC family protein [Pacificibacter marinus]MBU2866420.1 VOC family protein [Pacificibacter marinus]
MTASFGIDHPLLATYDIEKLRAHLIDMGFNMTAVGKHPWGTSTSLAMFNGCLLEIMGIYDDRLIDEVPAGKFRFGRHVYEHLQTREGVALTALHSTDSQADAATAQRAGFSVAGHLEFGRDVILPDGTAGRTKTTLALLPDQDFPRLSFFLCQQHRPDLIYVPEWLEHPNTVSGICGVTIVALPSHHVALQEKFGGLYGQITQIEGGFECTTANGILRVVDAVTFDKTIGPLAKASAKDFADTQTPFIAGMDFSAASLTRLCGILDRAGISWTGQDIVTLDFSDATANTVFRFFAA